MHNLQLQGLSHVMTEMECWLTPGLSVVQVRRISFLLLFVLSGCFLPSNVGEVRHVFLFFLFLRQKVDRPAPKHRRQLTTWQVLSQVERRFHSRGSNRQPLP
jgi:hypothetical protein